MSEREKQCHGSVTVDRDRGTSTRNPANNNEIQSVKSTSSNSQKLGAKRGNGSPATATNSSSTATVTTTASSKSSKAQSKYNNNNTSQFNTEKRGSRRNQHNRRRHYNNARNKNRNQQPDSVGGTEKTRKEDYRRVKNPPYHITTAHQVAARNEEQRHHLGPSNNTNNNARNRNRNRQSDSVGGIGKSRKEDGRRVKNLPNYNPATHQIFARTEDQQHHSEHILHNNNNNTSIDHQRKHDQPKPKPYSRDNDNNRETSIKKQINEEEISNLDEMSTSSSTTADKKDTFITDPELWHEHWLRPIHEKKEKEKNANDHDERQLLYFRGYQKLLIALDPSKIPTKKSNTMSDVKEDCYDGEVHDDNKGGEKKLSEPKEGKDIMEEEDDGSNFRTSIDGVDDDVDDDGDNGNSDEIKQLQKLPFVEDLCSIITRALNEILRMTDEKRENLKHLPRNRRRNQMSQFHQNPTPSTTNNGTEDDTTMMDEIDGTCYIIHKGNNNQNISNLRTKATFDTISTLVPTLYSILYHRQMHNKTLQMEKGPTTKVEKKSKEKLFLFGKNVYSTASKGEVKILRRDFSRLLSSCESYNHRTEHDVTIDRITSVLKEHDANCPGQHNLNHLQNSPFLEIVSEICKKGFCQSTEEICAATFPSSINDKHAYDKGGKLDKELIFPLFIEREATRKSREESVTTCLQILHNALSQWYHNVQLQIYGSCLSDLFLGKSSDVDISFHIFEFDEWKAKLNQGQMASSDFEKRMKKCVFKVRGSLQKMAYEFDGIQAVPHARVPVVKGRCINANNPLSEDGSLCFDICFRNDIAVVNSTLIKEYSLLDSRVKHLMLAVKSWVKIQGLGSAADGAMSSYTWAIMVIFYLQCIGFVPSLQCPQFLKLHKIHPNPSGNRWHGINDLNTVFVSSIVVQQRGIWKVPEKFVNMPASFLLSGFFTFYAKHFPYQTVAVSIRLGKCGLQKTSFSSGRFWRFCIEDPFETHTSHCPHDLGSPISENGQQRIIDSLRKSSDQYKDLFGPSSKVYDLLGKEISCTLGNIEALLTSNEDEKEKGREDDSDENNEEKKGPHQKHKRKSRRRTARRAANRRAREQKIM